MARIKEKHKEVLKKMSGNVGLSREAAQLEVGYSENYAKAGHIADTASWQELMEKHIPDSKLLKVEKEGLEANRVISAIKGTEANGGTTDFIEVPDHATRHKFLETGLKLKGKLKDKVDGSKTLIINISEDNAKRFGFIAREPEKSSE